MFDIEKERARWQMEHDNIISQNREKDDIIANLERRKDMLFKENERLKSEWKNNGRASLERTSIGSASNLSTNPGAIKLGLAMNKVNLPTQLSNQTANNIITRQSAGNLGLKKTHTMTSSLRGSQQNLPPHPQKLQLNSNNQPQPYMGNQRYVNMVASQSSQAVGGTSGSTAQPTHQDAHQNEQPAQNHSNEGSQQDHTEQQPPTAAAPAINEQEQNKNPLKLPSASQNQPQHQFKLSMYTNHN